MNNLNELIQYTSKFKLLYVEDDKDARETTLSILEEFFLSIKVACNGEEGLELFKSSEIDLIITDINMPKLNGLEMIGKIREIDKDVAILVLSAYNESGYFTESIRLNVEGYLLKPIELEQFLAILEKTMQKLKLKNKAEDSAYIMSQYEEATNRSALVSKTDTHGIITYVNDEFCKISQYSREELIGKSHNIVRHPELAPEIFQDMWHTIKDKKTIWQGIIKNLAKDGTTYYVKTTIKPILNRNNEIIEYISLRDDITDIMNPKRQLQDFLDFYKNTLVVLMKIDNFEDIQNFYGINITIKIEKQVYDIIKSIDKEFYGFEKVFHIGNGEYVYVKNANKSVQDIELLRNLQEELSMLKINVDLIEHDISMLMSVSEGVDSLENAQYGMKYIQNTHQDFIIANDFVEKESKEAQKNLETIKMIKSAVDNLKIISYFQPIINNKTQKIEKYESLVRLINEDNQVLSPFFFLDIAKKGKYYSKITSIVLENSFKALLMTDKDISINLSVLDIEKEFTREKIFTLLHLHKDDCHRVVFELLEDEDAKDFIVIKNFIRDVKELGVQIAIDDFGSGYSNFERLLDYQPDIVKIDGSLIKNIEKNELSLHIVETIIAFAKKQNIKIIAEYVENEKIFTILKELDVDYSQGYYFGKPKNLH